MSLIHGFYSSNAQVNPDLKMLDQATTAIPTLDDLVFAERFLCGDTCPDPVRAHRIVKLIFVAGCRQYPSLWDMASRHVHGYEYATLEKLEKLPSA